VTRRPGPTPEVVEVVLFRDGNRCVCCGGGLIDGGRGFEWSVHHRRGRDGKPDSHQPQNLIAVCGPDNVQGCHGRIHQRRSEAQPNGWWISRIAGTDPLTVPLLIERESRWVYLTADGRRSDDPPEG
jgi:hypothetical protein